MHQATTENQRKVGIHAENSSRSHDMDSNSNRSKQSHMESMLSIYMECIESSERLLLVVAD